jgi:hypothetical protein
MAELVSVKLSTLSTEYLRVQLSAFEAGAIVDPTWSLVAFAFVDSLDVPQESEWVIGEWEVADSQYFARILVGPEGHELLPGSYDVWVRANITPEIVAEHVGYIDIA